MRDLCLNFAEHYFRRHEGYSSRRLDRRYVHSQIRLCRMIRAEDHEFFTCCAFTACATSVVVGLSSGEVRVYSSRSQNDYATHQCYRCPVSYLKTSKNGSLLLTSNLSTSPVSKLWNIEWNEFSRQSNFFRQEYVEFSKLDEDKVLGTSGSRATIYDILSERPITTFIPSIANRCQRNKATFSPCNEIILSDGVLWDARSRDEIHKFDLENQPLSGVFHPNGYEIVSNTTVFDIRTLRVLRTVPELEEATVAFSPQNVIFGVSHIEGISTLRTLDSYDYSYISSTDRMLRCIADFSVNKYGHQLVSVENFGICSWYFDSTVRIYDVGKPPLEYIA
ncbi:Protein mahjong [Pseudolycoriella hygida]|uniref:Protein mahjong n=1 Tax=Pseudolycoriella hygida TaxID=35572 RepID=A0A9Q0N9C6_9DIPT|nr:Protein mahjong [Pseudolycoriella hygida]